MGGLFGRGFPKSQNRHPGKGQRLECPLGGGLLSLSNKRAVLKAPEASRQRLSQHLMSWPWVLPGGTEYIVENGEARRVVAL